MIDKYFSDKPEVSAEETIVHAGVGHQAILVCQVVVHHEVHHDIVEDHDHDNDDDCDDNGHHIAHIGAEGIQNFVHSNTFLEVHLNTLNR